MRQNNELETSSDSEGTEKALCAQVFSLAKMKSVDWLPINFARSRRFDPMGFANFANRNTPSLR